MITRSSIIIVLIFLTTTVSYAQTRKKKVIKPKPITATVTVKADPPIRPLPNESDEKSWTEFESKEDGLTLLFPGRKDDVSDDNVEPVRTFDVSTVKAHYMLAVRDVGSLINNQDTDSFLEQTIQDAFGAETKFQEKKKITYEGRDGRHIVLLDGDKRLAARLYLLNDKLFMISVTIKTTDYTPQFNKWIDKFFDSFLVKVLVIEA